MNTIARILNEALSDRLSPGQRDTLTQEFSKLGGGGGGMSVVSGRVGTLSTSTIDIDFAGGVLVRNFNGERTIHLRPDGNAMFGANLDRPETTSFNVFSVGNVYNLETMGSGDVMMGDNSPGRANLKWDQARGKLLFRGGKVEQVVIGVDGSLQAGSGAVVLNASGIVATAGAIGGWTLGAKRLSSGTGAAYVGLDSDPAGTYALWAGNATASSAPFRVSRAGAVTATSGAIGGWTLGTGTLVGGGVTLDAAGKVTVGSGPSIEIDGVNKWIQSSNYVSGVSGFRLSAAGDLEANNLTARGEFRASVFKVGEITATSGTLMVSKSAAVLWTDVSIPASGSFILRVKNAESGAPLFGASDRLRIKTWAGGGIGDTWLTVVSGSNQGAYTIYTVTVTYGTTGVVYPAGAAVVDYGTTEGFITLSADGTVGASPNLTMGLLGTPPNLTVGLRLGNLDGSYGQTGFSWGVGIGDYAGGNYLRYTPAGGLEVAGKVTATTGAIGGWALGASLLSSGSGSSYVGLSSDPAGLYALWAGAATAASAPFRVKRDGNAYVDNLFIGASGIILGDGAWIIDAGITHLGISRTGPPYYGFIGLSDSEARVGFSDGAVAEWRSDRMVVGSAVSSPMTVNTTLWRDGGITTSGTITTTAGINIGAGTGAPAGWIAASGSIAAAGGINLGSATGAGTGEIRASGAISTTGALSSAASGVRSMGMLGAAGVSSGIGFRSYALAANVALSAANVPQVADGGGGYTMAGALSIGLTNGPALGFWTGSGATGTALVNRLQINSDGGVAHLSSKIGFYGTAPVVQGGPIPDRGAIVEAQVSSAAGITTQMNLTKDKINNILLALRNVGLIT